MIHVDRHAFTTPLPNINGNSSIWKALLDAQDLIMKCTRYTMSLKKDIDAERDTSSHDSSFLCLNKEVGDLMARSIFTHDGMLFKSQIDSAEAVLIDSLQLQTQIKLHSARIKLHRYQAFQDIPIFTKKHCDLKVVPPEAAFRCPLLCQKGDYSLLTPEGSFFPSPADHTPHEYYQRSNQLESARLCRQSALAISKAFEDLPFPCPIQSDQFDLRNLNMLPRTMPSFACCAMQGSYVLLMSSFKGWGKDELADNEFQSNNQVTWNGLEKTLGALENYSMAFEALQGMTRELNSRYWDKT